ncbi:MAG: response regulator [Gammaproteobacteria bacterium]
MKPTVLVVDDSLTVRMDLHEAFEAAGFATTLCGSAEAARQALSRERFGVMVLDVVLPDADGVEFLEEIRANPSIENVPVLLLSTEAEVRDRIRGVATGADDYVGKPYDRAYVVSRAQELLRARAPAPGARTSPLILVIDDSASFREKLREALNDAGYTALLAATGEDGLRIAGASRPDCVLVDAGLPGMDGATLVRRMKLDAALRRTPCLLLTASEEISFELTALEAGAGIFVRKTEDMAVILARLAAMLRATVLPAAVTEEVASLFGPKKVLAVDDSITFLQELAAQIRQDGYDVIVAGSGAQALELLAVQRVDCILLDLIMPGLSGQEICRRIKTSPSLRDIPLVILTARDDRETMIEAFNRGADDYIPKDSDFDVIKARLRAQIRRKHFEDENRRIREELLQKEQASAERRTAQQLAQARAVLLVQLETANQELEAFSYSVSHDLRAPLRHIVAFTALLKEHIQGSLDEKGRRYLDQITQVAARMAELIEDLLSFSRMGRGALHKTTVSLTRLVEEVLREMEEETRGRDILWHIEALPEVQADPAMLRIVLTNLIANAIKYSRRRRQAEIAISATREAGQVVFCIRDNGVGFNMKFSDKLFGVFQRLHSDAEFEGTGVGLATVRRIIQRHGGRTWAEGVVDNGARFFFSLPEGER